MTSGEYLIAFFFMASFSQMSAPPRFRGGSALNANIDVQLIAAPASRILEHCAYVPGYTNA
jgi:hypothetical protein